jgi:hypothetical protein
MAARQQWSMDLAWFECTERADCALASHSVSSLRDDGSPECCGWPMRMLSAIEEVAGPLAARIEATAAKNRERQHSGWDFFEPESKARHVAGGLA